MQADQQTWLFSFAVPDTSSSPKKGSYAFPSSSAESMLWTFIPTFLFFTMLCSMMLSLPTLLAFYVAAYGLAITKLGIVWIKIILTGLGILGCVLTLPFLVHHKSLINSSSLILIACYGLPLMFSTMFYRLNSNLKI